MSIQQNFPAITPSLSLNFARSKTLDPRITFSRTSTATRVNEQGLVEVVSADEPRFDHEYDPVSGTVRSLGLLVEEGRTNLVTDSNGGDYGYDMSSGGSPTNDIAPDGSTVACKYDLSSNTGSPFLNCNVDTTLTNGVTYTMSMWVKGTTEFTVALAFVGETNYTVTSRNMDVTTSWTRETYTFTLSGNQTNSRLQVFFGTQGQGKIISIWGAQLEEGAFATSYIPRSAGSQSTRNPDSVSMEGENFSDWFNTDEGTLHMRISSTQGPQSGYPRLLMLTPAGQNSQNNSLQFIHANSSVGLSFALWQGGTIRRGYNKSVTGPEDKENIIFAYKSDGDTSVYVDGNSLTNTISATYAQPVFGRMGIGAYPGGEGTTPRTTIESLVYYPKRLTNTQLQNLTK